MRLVAEPMTARPQTFEVAKPALVLSLLASIPAVFDLSREAAAAGLGALVLLPLLMIWSRTRRLMVSDPIIVLGLTWILAVTLPVLVPYMLPDVYKDPLWHKVTPWALDVATLWMYRSWASCCVAYWGYRVLVSTRRPMPVSGVQLLLEDRLRLLVGSLGLLASVTYVISTGGQSYSHLEGFSSTTTVDQIIYEVRQLSMIYVFLYFQARGRGRLVVREGYLLSATVGVYALIFAGSSSKIVAIELAAMWVLGGATGAVRGNVVREIAIGVCALAIVYFTFYFVTAYRAELAAIPLKNNPSIGEALSTQFGAMQGALNSTIEGKELGNEENQYNVGSMFERLAYLASFATVLDYTHGYSPYENPYASLMAPVLAFVPRDLTGGKVQFLDSGTFAKLIGWELGGFSISIPGSFFWAWGFEGIVPGMMGFGLLLASFSSRGDQDGLGGLMSRSMRVRLVIGLLDVGNEFQGILISSTRTLMFLLVLLFVARNFRSPSPSSPHRRLRGGSRIGDAATRQHRAAEIRADSRRTR